MLKKLSKVQNKHWSQLELSILYEYYNICTLLELSKLLPGRSLNSIHSQVKRLRKQSKLFGGKAPGVRLRSRKQGVPEFMK